MIDREPPNAAQWSERRFCAPLRGWFEPSAPCLAGETAYRRPSGAGIRGISVTRRRATKTGAIVVTALLLTLTSEAEARCAQEDLAGRWRVFTMGVNVAGLGSVHECPVTVDNAGAFQPTACVDDGVATLASSGLEVARNCRLTGDFILILNDGRELTCPVSGLVSISKEVISGSLACGPSKSLLNMVRR
jgi:hypothetical protein